MVNIYDKKTKIYNGQKKISSKSGAGKNWTAASNRIRLKISSFVIDKNNLKMD